MLIWMQKILVSLAVFTVLGHGMISHHHREDFIITAHHNQDYHDKNGHNEDDHDTDHRQDHNPFSFKYLAHFYTPSATFPLADNTATYCILPTINYGLVSIETIAPFNFVLQNEHPPPLPLHHTISLRGPPASC